MGEIVWSLHDFPQQFGFLFQEICKGTLLQITTESIHGSPPAVLDWLQERGWQLAMRSTHWFSTVHFWQQGVKKSNLFSIRNPAKGGNRLVLPRFPPKQLVIDPRALQLGFAALQNRMNRLTAPSSCSALFITGLAAVYAVVALLYYRNGTLLAARRKEVKPDFNK